MQVEDIRAFRHKLEVDSLVHHSLVVDRRVHHSLVVACHRQAEDNLLADSQEDNHSQVGDSHKVASQEVRLHGDADATETAIEITIGEVWKAFASVHPKD